MEKVVALALLVLMGTVGFSAYAYTIYLPNMATGSPGSGTLNIYLADTPPTNHTLKYLLVNVTSVTIKYSDNTTAATSSTSTSSTMESTTSSSSSSTMSTSAAGDGGETENNYVYNVSSIVGTNVNLTKYQGSPLLLGSPKVPAGNVTGIILNITGARAYWTDGTSSQLKVVANGKLMANVQFTIQSGGTANMNIDIAPSSVHVSSAYILRPVLMVTVTTATSTTSSTTGVTSSETSSSSATSSSSSSQSST